MIIVFEVHSTINVHLDDPLWMSLERDASCRQALRAWDSAAFYCFEHRIETTCTFVPSRINSLPRVRSRTRESPNRTCVLLRQRGSFRGLGGKSQSRKNCSERYTPVHARLQELVRAYTVRWWRSQLLGSWVHMSKSLTSAA